MRSYPNLSEDQIKAILNHILKSQFSEAFKDMPQDQKEEAINKYAEELRKEKGDFPRDELNPQKMWELAAGLAVKLVLENKPLDFTPEEKAFIEERRKPENADKPLTPEEQKLADSIEKKLDNLQSAITSALTKNKMLQPSSESVVAEEGLGGETLGFDFEPDHDFEQEEAKNQERDVNRVSIITEKSTTGPKPSPNAKEGEDEEEEEEEEEITLSGKKKKPLMEQLAGIDLDNPSAMPVHMYLGNFFDIDFNPNRSTDLSQLPSQDRVTQIDLGNLQYSFVTNYEKHLEKVGQNVEQDLQNQNIISNRYTPQLRP